MLSAFDWLRKASSGSDFLAILRILENEPDFFDEYYEIGPVPTALNTPCRRCWIYAPGEGDLFCETCKSILSRRKSFSDVSRYTVLIWGTVNQIPYIVQNIDTSSDHRPLVTYIHDNYHFLVALKRNRLRAWMQDLVLHHGHDLQGHVQIFPTVGVGIFGMGDLFSRIVHHSEICPRNQLMVYFFPHPRNLFFNNVDSRSNLLTFDIAEFVGTLEMAEVFRALIRPDEQEELYNLLKRQNKSGEQFFWGRLLGSLSQEAKDMLSAWRIRQWPWHRVKLLYEVINYVGIPHISSVNSLFDNMANE